MTDVDCRGCNVSNAVLFNGAESRTIHPIGSNLEFIYGLGMFSIVQHFANYYL